MQQKHFIITIIMLAISNLAQAQWTKAQQKAASNQQESVKFFTFFKKNQARY